MMKFNRKKYLKNQQSKLDFQKIQKNPKNPKILKSQKSIKK